MSVKVALCQVCADKTPAENLEKIIDMVSKAAHEHADVVVFPEYCYCSPETPEEYKTLAEPVNGKYAAEICKTAKKNNINIIAGSFLENDSGKIYNTCLFVNRNGNIIGKYRKIHLMKAMDYDESKYVSHGNGMAVFDTDIGRIGIMVCYDLRFPELARSMVINGADMIFVPAEFPVGSPLPSRTDHWDLLVRSVALHNTTYVAAVNQYGRIKNENMFGQSCVVDPWGTVIASASNREEIIYADIDFDYQKTIREKLGVLKNRRPNMYSL